MLRRGDFSGGEDDREVTVYSAASPLRRPRQFGRVLRQDLSTSRGLAWRLFVRDARSQHRRSLLGYLWILLPVLASSFVWVFLDDQGVIDTEHGDVSYGVFVLIGTSLWQGFVDGLNVPFTKLDIAQGMITKYKVPPEALVMTGILEVALSQTVRMALVAIVALVAGVDSSALVLLVPLGVLALVLLGVEIGSFLAPFGLLYKDVPRAVQILTMVWFFVTPIIYSSSDAPKLDALNPVSILLVACRDLVLGEHAPLALAAGWSIAIVALLPFTFALYRLATPHLVDRAVS